MKHFQAGSAAPAPRVAGEAAKGTAVFYRFTDRDGTIHLVDSWENVPREFQAKTQRIELGSDGGLSGWNVLPARVDWPSFGVGFASALALGLVLLAFRRFGRTGRIVLGIVVLALVAGVYFGLLRRAAGESGDLVSTPSAIIEDARRTVDKANEHNRQREQLLEDLKREAK